MIRQQEYWAWDPKPPASQGPGQIQTNKLVSMAKQIKREHFSAKKNTKAKLIIK